MEIVAPKALRKIDRTRLTAKRVFVMIAKLGQWCESRPSVHSAYLVNSDTHLEAFVVGVDEAYNFDLSAEVCDFSLDFIKSGVLGNATMIPYSEDCLSPYFNPAEAIKVWGR